MKKLNRNVILSILLAILLSATVLFAYNHFAYERREIELGNDPCLALDPSCGYCPGERIGNKCFEKKNRYFD